MDQPLPTAEELGVSALEYERILRGLGRQAPPTAVPRPESRRPRPWVVAVIAVAAVVVVLSRGGSVVGAKPAFAFMDVDNNGHPVTYSSCKPINVAVYPAGGPKDAEKLVREAVDVMRSATGLNITVVGSFGGHAPAWNFQAAPYSVDDPVGVSWQDGAAIKAMTDDTAGLGGSPVIDGRDGSRHRVAGTIALSRDYYAHLDRIGDHAEAVAVLLHEFGHVLGLAHVQTSSELMYEGNVGKTTLGPGDLEGLAQLGRGPCV